MIGLQQEWLANQDQDNIIQDENNHFEEKSEKNCEGCGKTCTIDSFFRHFRRGQNCREKYGTDRYNQMKLERKKSLDQRNHVKGAKNRHQKKLEKNSDGNFSSNLGPNHLIH